MDLLTLKQTRERAAHLITADLELLVAAQKDLRHYYKHGTYKKFTKYNTSGSKCIFCDTVGNTIGRYIGKCPSCPWTILTGKTCMTWYEEQFPLVKTDYSEPTLNDARMQRLPKFTSMRIQMLDKWTRRLNAVIARRKGLSPTKRDTPRYVHDCKNCKFLGQYKEFDLYVCGVDKKINTVVARYSSVDSDYVNGLTFAINYRMGMFKRDKNISALEKALTRAEKLGFVV